MSNDFKIPILYNGKDYLFPASLIQYQYSYKIEINVLGTIVYFEPDEERNYRALMDPWVVHHAPQINKVLLQLISAELHALFNDKKK